MINQKGFSVVEIVLVIFVLGILGAGGWYIATQNSSDSEENAAVQVDSSSDGDSEDQAQASAYETVELKYFTADFPTGGEPTSDSKSETGKSLDIERDYGFIRAYARTSNFSADAIRRNGVIGQNSMMIDGKSVVVYQQSPSNGGTESKPLILQSLGVDDVAIPGEDGDVYFSVSVDMLTSREVSDDEVTEFLAEGLRFIESVKFK